jgi:hypothetical protein
VQIFGADLRATAEAAAAMTDVSFPRSSKSTSVVQ